MLASASPEVLIAAIARGDRADPRRQRRRDAAPLQPVQGRRDVQRSSAASSPAGSTSGSVGPPGTDPLTMFALQRDRRQASPDDFPEQLAELLAYLEDDFPPDHPFARLAPTLPGRPALPDVWLLGSSPQSAIWAGELGLPYAFADFINPAGAEIATALPRALPAVERESERARGPRSRSGCSAPRPTRRPQHLASSSRMTFTHAAARTG